MRVCFSWRNGRIGRRQNGISEIYEVWRFLKEYSSARVKDVMTQRPVCCHASDSAQSVAKALRDQDIGSVPVVGDGDSQALVGIITDRDLCCSIIA